MAEREDMAARSGIPDPCAQFTVYRQQEQLWARLEDLFKQILVGLLAVAERSGTHPVHELLPLREVLSRNLEVDALVAEVEKIAAALHKGAPDGEPAASVHGGSGGGDGSPGAAGGRPEISPNELIIDLLERLSLPAELQPKVHALREQLLQPLAREIWPAILQGVCDLVAAMRLRVQKEKEDLEKFLAQLTTRLQELDERVQGARSDQEAARRSGEALNVAVSAQVNGIAESFERGTAPNQLKAAIQDRLDEIRRHMDAYRAEEMARHQQADERVQALLYRLHELEAETETLRARVHAQRSQALRDSLTGIYNRLAYEERIEQEYVRWKRFQEPVSIMVWDVDRFKTINDTHGHKAGDAVLVSIAKLLAYQIRETDFVARYGGEEFVIIAPGCSAEASLVLAEKLRQSVAQMAFEYRGTALPVTISCGIAEFEQGATPDVTFERADQALYRAKQAGRNRCVIA